MSDGGPERARRLWMMFAIAAAALLVGVVAATSAMLLAGWRYLPERKFEVTVYLEPDVPEEQHSAIRSKLGDLPAGDEVRFESREEALAKLKEKWKHQPDRVEGIQLESMSESFQITAVAREFDCGSIPAIRDLPGVERVRVLMRPTANRYGAELGC